jgi:hypothetical protein
MIFRVYFRKLAHGCYSYAVVNALCIGTVHLTLPSGRRTNGIAASIRTLQCKITSASFSFTGLPRPRSKLPKFSLLFPPRTSRSSFALTILEYDVSSRSVCSSSAACWIGHFETDPSSPTGYSSRTWRCHRIAGHLFA